MPAALKLEYCGEWHDLDPGRTFTVGREGDLVIDDNPELDRSFIEIFSDNGMWWIACTSRDKPVQVSDPSGRVSTVIAPGARAPVVFDPALVVFVAGRTTYELAVRGPLPYSAMTSAAEHPADRADLPRLTLNQRLLLAVLCERALLRPLGGSADFPTSAAAARRLGWSLTAFNRKLDNVCERLDRSGVSGLRGGRGNLATRRRARLIDYALSSRLVTLEDLALLPPAEVAHG